MAVFRPTATLSKPFLIARDFFGHATHGYFTTDGRVYGDQEGRFFHGYCDHYCFLPLYVFCHNQLLVKRLRQVWPQVKIILRGDSGFCGWRMLSWCERHDVGYIVGDATPSL